MIRREQRVGKTATLEDRRSNFIPVGGRHRNGGEKPLFLNEVPSGSDLSEDDIERFEDHNGHT